MSPKKVALGVLLISFAAIIVALAIGKARFEKEQAEVQSGGQVVAVAQPKKSVVDQNMEKGNSTPASTSSEKPENSSKQDIFESNSSSSVSEASKLSSSVSSSSVTETSSSTVAETSTSKVENVGSVSGQPTSNGVLPAEAPDLSQVSESKGFVEKKEVLILDGVYLYNLKLAFSVDGETVSVPFFVQSSTYNTIDTGALMNIKYSKNSNGNLSIVQVTPIK